MTRTKLYLSVEIEHPDAKETQKLAAELIRTIKKMYGVRQVEVSHTSSDELPDAGEL